LHPLLLLLLLLLLMLLTDVFALGGAVPRPRL
jgi:hypothetical protein